MSGVSIRVMIKLMKQVGKYFLLFNFLGEFEEDWH